jgi:hypothetical protein
MVRVLAAVLLLPVVCALYLACESILGLNKAGLREVDGRPQSYCATASWTWSNRSDAGPIQVDHPRVRLTGYRLHFESFDLRGSTSLRGLSTGCVQILRDGSTSIVAVPQYGAIVASTRQL